MQEIKNRKPKENATFVGLFKIIFIKIRACLTNFLSPFRNKQKRKMAAAIPEARYDNLI
ncbi:MAG: hypothetical protein RI894_2064 [Bacteroidota bacterium]|jgi:hypothetical protein